MKVLEKEKSREDDDEGDEKGMRMRVEWQKKNNTRGGASEKSLSTILKVFFLYKTTRHPLIPIMYKRNVNRAYVFFFGRFTNKILKKEILNLKKTFNNQVINY